jgi:ring-1,2-phenylacetyl-CoA epoxidase subunit PaaD
LVLTKEHIFNLLSTIPDPEIPVINIVDLGILRSVEIEDGKVIVSITPTYSGCPAMKVIEGEIENILHENGITDSVIKTIYSPAWTTDWLNEDAKERLKKYGISSPGKLNKINAISGDKKIICPRCDSPEVIMVSLFGSTACKALYKCNACLEPFDHFKCH